MCWQPKLSYIYIYIYTRNKWGLLFHHLFLCVKKDKEKAIVLFGDSHSTKTAAAFLHVIKFFFFFHEAHRHRIEKQNNGMIKWAKVLINSTKKKKWHFKYSCFIHCDKIFWWQHDQHAIQLKWSIFLFSFVWNVF